MEAVVRPTVASGFERVGGVGNQVPLLVYDGDCGFCTTWVSLLGRLVRRGYRSVAWQRADLRDLGLSAERCQRAVQWVGAAGERAEGADAVAALLVSAGGPLARAFGRLLGHRAVAPAARHAYWVVAANRHLLHRQACRAGSSQRSQS